MARTAEAIAGDPPRTTLPEILPGTAPAGERLADGVRALVLDTVDEAGGEAGFALGMADAGATLWGRFLKFDAADPHWADRDRFVLSAGHGALLLYAMLHLTGHAGMGVEELRRFRRLDAPTGGHPGFGEHPAIEATTGPAGQGLGTAVGMALAERMMAARFGKSLVDHRTWALACDADLAAGVSHEALVLAGHLRLDKLAVLCLDPASGGLTDYTRWIAAIGWAVKPVDATSPADIASALSFAVRSRKPTFIVCRGSEAGNAAGNAGASLARFEPFVLTDRVTERWRDAGIRGAAARRAWLKRLAHHPMRAEFERATAGRLPENWHEAVAALRAGFAEDRPEIATVEASRRVLDALAPAVPELAGGASLAAEPDAVPVDTLGAVTPGSYAGRHVPFGPRAHGMAACLNGMAVHGGVAPFGAARLVATDSMRPAIRLAALMRQRIVYLLTDDSIGAGEDGAARQPVEQLAGLRAMPNLQIFRPACAMETAECWELALRRADGPSMLVLSRQPLPALRGDTGENRAARGGYVLAEAEGARQVTLIATGSEVGIAMVARDALAADGLAAAVVSLPCWELFAGQDEAYRMQVLGGVPRIGIEAACGFGWERWLGEGGVFVGMTGFGASAPYEDLYRHFGITPEVVVTAVRKRLN